MREKFNFGCHCEPVRTLVWQSTGTTFYPPRHCEERVAERSESKITMIAGGNHTLIHATWRPERKARGSTLGVQS